MTFDSTFSIERAQQKCSCTGPFMSAELPGCHRYLNRIAPPPLVPVQLDRSLPPVWCKLEFLNPSGSTKDRIARFILKKRGVRAA